MEMTEIFCLVKKKKKKRWKRQPLMEKDRNILSSEKEEEKMDRNVSPWWKWTEIFSLVEKKKKRRKRQPLMEMDRNILSSEKEEKMETSALDGNGQKYLV